LLSEKDIVFLEDCLFCSKVLPESLIRRKVTLKFCIEWKVYFVIQEDIVVTGNMDMLDKILTLYRDLFYFTLEEIFADIFLLVPNQTS